MLTQLKHTVRGLVKTPGFTLAALGTLGICLGASLAIFAVVDAILIRPLPFPDPGKLVKLYYVYPQLPNAVSGASLTSYYERRGQISALSSLSSINLDTGVVGETGATTFEKIGRVTPEFFDTLGVKLYLGRAFSDAEMTYQTDHVAIVSYEYWKNHYSGDRSILGKPVRIGGISRVIVGVLPPHFQFLSFQAPVYMPLSSEDAERNLAARHNLGSTQIGRLAAGASLADVQAQIDAHDLAHAAEYPQAKVVADAGFHTVVAFLQADFVAPVKAILILLQAGAFCLLLIGAVNLTNLFLIRWSGRTQEVAVRQALGATQRHILSAVMNETILLAALGAILGLIIGAAGIKLLVALGADQLPLGSRIEFDGRFAAVAFATALATGLIIGLPVVWFNLKGALGRGLQIESRSATASRATYRLRNIFIIAQIALAFVLLTGASLLGFSLKKTMAVQPGFRADHVITGQFTLPWSGYNTLDAFRKFFDRLFEKTNSFPDIKAIGAISDLPVRGTQSTTGFNIPGYRTAPSEAVPIHNNFGVAGNYFAAMEIPLIEGRYLNEDDTDRNEQVCVVDEAFARHYWPNGAALGKQIYRGLSVQKGDNPFTVVGVVGTVKQTGLTEKQAKGTVYTPYTQTFNRNYFLVARSRSRPDLLATLLLRAVRDIDPEIPLNDLRTMELRITDSLATRRSPALMASIFAATALILASVGLYGVMAYSVMQRVREFGIRIALGAKRRDVLCLVFGQGVRLTIFGLAIGALAASWITGYMSSVLFDVSPDDAITFVGVATLLSVVASIACILPALRATKVNPLLALRA